MGFAVGTLELPHHPREDGKSSYTFAKLARLAAEAILAHSQTPLKLATYFGLAMAVVSILAGLSIERRVHFLKKVLDPPGYAYTPGTPLHRGSRRVHRMRRRRGGGPATWARWSMARASASTLDGARGLSARTVSITPPPGHYEPGAVGLHRRCLKGRRRAVSDRTAARRTSRTKNRAGRQATGILKHCEPVPGVLLPCSLTVRRPLPGNARGDRACACNAAKPSGMRPGAQRKTPPRNGAERFSRRSPSGRARASPCNPLRNIPPDPALPWRAGPVSGRALS